MRRAIATVSLSGTLEEKLAAAAGAGFDAIELFEDDLIASRLRPAEVRARAQDLGLGIDLYQPFRDFEAVPEAVLARNLRRAEAKLALMEALGASMVLVCSSVSPAAGDDDDLAAEQLHALAERAAARGMRVAYEALAWGRHVHDYEHGWRIVQAAGHPALGVCLDSFHILSRGADPSGISAIPAEKLFFLQLADAPALDMNLLQWSRHHRCFPGQGSFDLAAFLGHVVAAGYGGPLSLEVFNDVFRQADAARTAVDGMRSLLVLEDALEPRLPAAPALGGHAFVELAGELALAALGFTRTRRHRSKPVELWTQAGARVVLNHGEPGGPRVLAVAVESADPAASAERARALLAPVTTPPHGPGEADLETIAAPDGSAVVFCRTDAADGWLGDFVPDAPAEAGAGLTGIDHVALAHPFDAFDEAALFYRSVLALRPQELREVPSPAGLVTSRAVSDAGGRVRLVLNVPPLEGGAQAPLQHVAFACADILATARALRARGAPLLRVSDNYYDDLAARSELDPAVIEELRELGILYDRSGDRELLHLFTDLVGPGLFFEVLERRGGHDGYGHANAPVRMVAQRSANA